MKKRWIVIIGVVLFLIVALLFRSCVHNRCRKEIENRIAAFNRALGASQYDMAFAFMTPAYRSSHDLATFKNEFISGIELEDGWDLSFRRGTAWIYPYGEGFLEFRNGLEYEMKQIDDEWFFTGEYEQYYD